LKFTDLWYLQAMEGKPANTDVLFQNTSVPDMPKLVIIYLLACHESA